jgi:hypothetical protein
MPLDDTLISARDLKRQAPAIRDFQHAVRAAQMIFDAALSTNLDAEPCPDVIFEPLKCLGFSSISRLPKNHFLRGIVFELHGNCIRVMHAIG